MHDAEGKHRLEEVIEFGERLIATGDLDPVYVALYAAKLPTDQLYRLLLAYFCFYHLGAAAFISEGSGLEFWRWMRTAAENRIAPPAPGFERWPRGAERRHFRGPKCVAAVQWFRDKAPSDPEFFMRNFCGGRKWALNEVMERVEAWPLFGPWISFKAADVLERVLDVSVRFPEDLTLLYAEPRKTLDMLELPAEAANIRLLNHFSKIKAPPDQGRWCNIQEVETICCKVKSHWNGHYWVGKDIHEIKVGLRGWGATADKLGLGLPAEIKRDEGLFA